MKYIEALEENNVRRRMPAMIEANCGWHRWRSRLCQNLLMDMKRLITRSAYNENADTEEKNRKRHNCDTRCIYPLLGMLYNWKQNIK